MSNVKEFYDKHSYKYEEFEAEALINSEKYPLLYDIRNKERNLLDKARGKKVFYFATGSGSDIAYLAKIGAKIVTLDFSIEMINRTIDRLKEENVTFELLQNRTGFTKEFIDNFFDSGKQVLILLADINDIVLPENYFDYTFCYCTLPLLQKNWHNVLKKMISISKNGAVSVYLKEKIAFLHQYYTDFGFDSQVEDRTIFLKGGFAYYCIPPEEIIKSIEEEKKLEIIDVGLGKIYIWSTS